MGQNRFLGTVIAIVLVATSAPMAEAARVPDRQVNGIEWFYVFGRQGNRSYGAAEGQAKQVFYVEVPKDLGGSVTIRVLDADLQGRHDEVDGVLDTSTKFDVFGGSKLLTSRTITASEPDGTTLELGPFALNQGDTQGDRVIFRVEAEGLEGNDSNLFAFEVEPSQAQIFTFNPAIRLSSHEGHRMRFFPQIPSGVTGIRVWNYDLDPTGGNSVLLTPLAATGSVRGTQKAFWIENSRSAAWARTDVTVPQAWTGGGQWIYQITKKTQSEANMSMRVEDQTGKPMRIYFTQGEPIQVAQAPARACNAFEFDASRSYDPNNQALTYAWDFGDGTAGDQIRMGHMYDKAGDYKVMLTVSDTSTGECRSSKTEQLIRANTLPTATLEAPTTACAGSTVQLSAAKSTDTSGDQLRYAWDLGDGTMAEGAKATHAYTRGGTYPIKLLVDDGLGTSCSRVQATASIRVNASPIAKANEAVTLCARNATEPQAVTFTAAGSQDPDHDKLTYKWDFGDGGTAEGMKATHSYEKGGRYTAKLSVDDGSGMTCGLATASVPVTINHAPIARVNRQDVTTCGGETLAFDASASSDSDGDTLAYRWDFGDGDTATGAKVSHQYAKGGTYRVSVAVDDGSGMACALSTASLTARANTPPLAVAKVEEMGCASRSLSFDASNSSDPEGQRLTYRWDFGDGATAAGAKARHGYAKGGTYPITLTVDDGQGTACSLAVAKAETRINTPPVAKAGPNSVVCLLNNATAFDASKSIDSDGDPLTYRWEFGDGTTAEGVSVQHQYAKRGEYQVRVIASDNSGGACASSSSGFVATVNEAPVAKMEISRGGKDVFPTAQELAADVKRNR